MGFMEKVPDHLAGGVSRRKIQNRRTDRAPFLFGREKEGCKVALFALGELFLSSESLPLTFRSCTALNFRRSAGNRLRKVKDPPPREQKKKKKRRKRKTTSLTHYSCFDTHTSSGGGEPNGEPRTRKRGNRSVWSCPRSRNTRHDLREYPVFANTGAAAPSVGSSIFVTHKREGRGFGAGLRLTTASTMLLGSMDSFLPPRSDRSSQRHPLRQLSLGQDPLPASPLISNRNLVPGLSESVVQLDMLGKGGCCGWRV